jgi:diaminohydroxyphosphoribosylaminopyrimidine deaminase/5-amino-6-(5-phosphoribosylamino)uracil reductase
MPSPEYYMRLCLDLAQQGAGQVAPNPMVGSVLVYEDQVIGQGYHQQYGEAHAEVNCIRSVQAENYSLIEKSVLYVTLEPCSHTGKTPPCVDLILQHKIPKVVVGCRDISDKVNGKGIQKLREQGVEVVEGIVEQECQWLNRRFFTFHKHQRPYIILKWAQSKDGFIGRYGQQLKLSCDDTNREVHRWRAEEAGIWVGYRTAQNDNPHLTVRHVDGNHPVRIVYDRDLSLPQHLQLFDGESPTLIFNTLKSEKKEKLQYVQIDESQPLESMLQHLHQQQILSVLVEGGRDLLQLFFEKGYWDEARMIQTPHLLHEGIAAPSWPQGEATTTISGDDVIYNLLQTNAR